MSSDSSDNESPNLDASATESDDCVDSASEADEENATSATSKPIEELVKEKITEKYKERQGKQLYIRFPTKLPAEDDEFQKKVHALSPLIIKAHKPRQKHARFCLVDFNSKEDRYAAMTSIRNSTKIDANMKSIVVAIPRTETEQFVNELVNKKLETIERRRAKTRLRRAAKQAQHNKKFTPTIVVRNLPVNVSMVEMRTLFPNAVDIQMISKLQNKRSSVASVTLSSTLEARAVIRKKLSLGGTQLLMRFDVHKPKKSNKSSDKNKTNSSDENTMTAVKRAGEMTKA